MGKILKDFQAARIRKLNREFGEKFPNWMCEGSEDAEGRPCNIIFNNDTDEYFLASYSGNIIGCPFTTITTREDMLEMARIQGEIRQIAL